MLTHRTINFSVKPSETKNAKLVEDLKMYAITNGISFSHICIEALKKYKAEVIDNG